MNKTIRAPVMHTNAEGVHMRTTIELKGVPDLILDKAVRTGLARSKTDALRMGIFSLNEKYGLVKDVEQELLVRRLELDHQENLHLGRYLSEEEALAPYQKILKKTKTQ